jgi:hypothetical protein
MKRITIAILLCWACKHEATWSGLPDHDRAQCGSFQETAEAVCVVDGDAYTCVADDGCRPSHIECALVAKPPTSIGRKKSEVRDEQQRQQQQIITNQYQ